MIIFGRYGRPLKCVNISYFLFSVTFNKKNIQKSTRNLVIFGQYGKIEIKILHFGENNPQLQFKNIL